MSRGCLALLRAGARVCAGAADVLAVVPAPEDRPDARLLDALSSEPSPAERIAERAGVPIAIALGALLRLEWAGIAEPCPGGRWRRAPEASA